MDLKHVLRSLSIFAPARIRRWRWHRFYNRCIGLTMISRENFLHNLGLASQIRNLPGCVIECGVWRGGMSAGLAMVLGSERSYFLFDSFQGLPPAKEIDGESALEWQHDTQSPGYFDNCSAPPEFARKAMTMAGAKKFQLIKGWFNETLPGFRPPEPIALLRLDADWYDSTMVCLDCLFDYVAPGGLIVLDDYYTWDGCSRALHDFLSRRSAAERIRNIGTVCFIEKIGSKDMQSAVAVCKPDTHKPNAN